MKLTESYLTQRQKEVLKSVYQSIKNSGFPPTLAELKEQIDVVSNQAVIDLLKILEEKRCIKREEGMARGLKILKKGYQSLGVSPLIAEVGLSSAGPFLEAIEKTGNWQEVSSQIKKLEDNVYIIKIAGDSMIGAGIQDGDMLLVKSAQEFVSGDIVLVQSPDGTTVKKFISEDKPPYLYLKPENPKYPIIYFNEAIKMIGKIIGKFVDGQWITPYQGNYSIKKIKSLPN